MKEVKATVGGHYRSVMLGYGTGIGMHASTVLLTLPGSVSATDGRGLPELYT